MRAVFGLVLLAAVTTLGGCGQSEAQIRDELRAQMLQRCGRDIAPNTSVLPGFDSDAYCRCVTDKAMGERGVAELKTLFDDRARLTAEGRRAATECLAGQSLDGPAGAGAPAAEPANVTAPAPAPAAESARDSARERERERERDRERAREPVPSAPARPRIEETRESPHPRTEPVAPPRATPPSPPRAVPPGFTPPPEPAVRDEEAGPGDRR